MLPLSPRVKLAIKFRRKETFQRLQAKYGPVCWYCGQEINEFTGEIDHIIPRAKGGSSKLENLALACRSCNRAKDQLPLQTFLDWLVMPKTTTRLIKLKARRARSEPLDGLLTEPG